MSYLLLFTVHLEEGLHITFFTVLCLRKQMDKDNKAEQSKQSKSLARQIYKTKQYAVRQSKSFIHLQNYF